MNFLDAMDDIVYAVMALWDTIKNFIRKAVLAFSNIVSFFKNPNRLAMLKRNRDLMAIAVKEKLANNEYRVVNCLFDKVQSEVVDTDENAQRIEAEELAQDTINNFGDNPMVVLS